MHICQRLTHTVRRFLLLQQNNCFTPLVIWEGKKGFLPTLIIYFSVICYIYTLIIIILLHYDEISIYSRSLIKPIYHAIAIMKLRISISKNRLNLRCIIFKDISLPPGSHVVIDNSNLKFQKIWTAGMTQTWKNVSQQHKLLTFPKTRAIKIT